MVKILKTVVLLLALLITAELRPSALHADISDPFDVFDFGGDPEIDMEEDEQKTPEQLILEANVLLDDERLLDARTKLLTALKKDPKEYRAHLLLSGYYMVHVGHFRLALKYVKQAQKLFEEKNGAPPYRSEMARGQHARVLYLLSQARLSLDDYAGALAVLDEFASYGYFEDWYPGTRAWVLMKVGKLQEAIKVARMGVFSGAEVGRTLNMLGILLSMVGERQESIGILKQAISYEMALGKFGQPATPLNNVGEVYEEIFSEEQAQASYLRATSLPDGCENVLPSLNLAFLYLDELNSRAAQKTMDDFESCIAQYPLRNGEEHRALVHLVRGRIELSAGNPDKAVVHFRDALEHTQWFGKIGTDKEDLIAGALLSLGQALEAENNRLDTSHFDSVGARLSALQQRTINSINAWWALRRAKQILVDDLSNLEDLYVRNTDSMIEYPSLGRILREFSRKEIQRRIDEERRKDTRVVAQSYYDLYLAENLAYGGRESEAYPILQKILSNVRSRYDDGIKLRAYLILGFLYERESEEYARAAYEIYALSKAALRNNGLVLPINTVIKDSDVREKLADGPFLIDNSKVLPYKIAYEIIDGRYTFEVSSNPDSAPGDLGRRMRRLTLSVNGETLTEALEKLSQELFVEKL